MCQYCIPGPSRLQIECNQVLDLLALIERPDVLPAGTALRIANKLLAWADQKDSRLQCEAVSFHETRLNAVT